MHYDLNPPPQGYDTDPRGLINFKYKLDREIYILQ